MVDSEAGQQTVVDAQHSKQASKSALPSTAGPIVISIGSSTCPAISF